MLFYGKINISYWISLYVLDGKVKVRLGNPMLLETPSSIAIMLWGYTNNNNI
jgi:hypothetical protein